MWTGQGVYPSLAKSWEAQRGQPRGCSGSQIHSTNMRQLCLVCPDPSAAGILLLPEHIMPGTRGQVPRQLFTEGLQVPVPVITFLLGQT